MSGTFSYERYDSRSRPVAGHRRSLFGFWVPITITVTLAAGGLAAWVFRARDEHETTSVSSDDENLSYGADDTDRITPKPSSGSGGAIATTAAAAAGASQNVSEGVEEHDEDSTIVGRVQGMMRRTPSPQQVLDGARKGVVAGVAAVGGMVGGALSSIREDREEGAYEDHERWRRDEATATTTTAAGVGRAAVSDGQKGSAPGGKRRTIAIVISAEEGDIRSLEEEEEDGWKAEHAVCIFCYNFIRLILTII
jgi:hypothetical protein